MKLKDTLATKIFRISIAALMITLLLASTCSCAVTKSTGKPQPPKNKPRTTQMFDY
jgi:hypothetical protein